MSLRRPALRLLLLVALLAGCAVRGVHPVATQQGASQAPRILVFSRTTGWRHDSIPAAIETLRELGAEAGLVVEHTEDPARFDATNLTRYSAVVFANTTLDVFDASQQAAFERFVGTGGGFVGIHSAADTEYDWAWYGELVGAWFDSHPLRAHLLRGLRYAIGQSGDC
jgi:type 1 glutamine amidotransferase